MNTRMYIAKQVKPQHGCLNYSNLLKSLAEAGKKFDPDGETSPGH